MFTLLSLFTFVGSTHIVLEGIKDGLINIANRGYKFDYNKFFKEKVEQKDIKCLGKFLPLTVPGVNLFFSTLLADDFKEEMQVELRDYFIPLNTWEKNHYKELDSDNKKIDYIKKITLGKKEKNKVKQLIEKKERKVVIPSLKRVFIQNDRLKDTYTLDEVKRLNNTTGHLYRVGKLDGKYVAIIGNDEQDPNEDDKVKIVEFLFEEEIEEHKFFPENEVNITDKRFIVYTKTNNKKLENCIKQIKMENKNNSIRKEIENMIDLKYQLTEENSKVKTLKK